MAVSAAALGHEREIYLQTGCDDFIAKPFKLDRVCASIEQILGVQFLQKQSHSRIQPGLDLNHLILPERIISKMVLAAEPHSATSLNACLKELEAIGPQESRLAEHLAGIPGQLRYGGDSTHSRPNQFSENRSSLQWRDFCHEAQVGFRFSQADSFPWLYAKS